MWNRSLRLQNPVLDFSCGMLGLFLIPSQSERDVVDVRRFFGSTLAPGLSLDHISGVFTAETISLRVETLFKAVVCL